MPPTMFMTWRKMRVAFVGGLIGGGLLLRAVHPVAFEASWTPTVGLVAIAGLLVGVGTQLGSGCTSGHGICGISRWSSRSLFATATFMATGMATVFVVHHVVGGWS